jgi:hypothetical protein
VRQEASCGASPCRQQEMQLISLEAGSFQGPWASCRTLGALGPDCVALQAAENQTGVYDQNAGRMLAVGAKGAFRKFIGSYAR